MKDYLVTSKHLDLGEWPTGPSKEALADKEAIKAKTAKLSDRLGLLQELLYAEHKQRVLVVLQGLDTSGKDSTVRHVFAPVGPAGIRVVSFKGPTAPELEHDYLWRIHPHVPGNGELVVFNRSHYEELLIVRVQKLAPESVWKKRFDHINAFEKLLTDEGTTIIKIFLHISKNEQKRRLQERLDTARKIWKFDPNDLRDRDHWKYYWEAYEEAMGRTSTGHAPWYVIPSDKKWWRDHLITSILVNTLEGLKMSYPKPKSGLSKIRIR